MFWVRVPAYHFHATADTTSRRVTALLVFRWSAINLVKLGIVDVCPKRIFHGIKISLVSVRCDLDAVLNSLRAIFHKVMRPPAITPAN